MKNIFLFIDVSLCLILLNISPVQLFSDTSNEKAVTIKDNKEVKNTKELKDDKLSLKEQNDKFFEVLKKEHNLSDETISKIKTIFSSSPVLSQGNPKITVHPISKEECLKNLKSKNINYYNKKYEKICGHKYMAPLYNPDTTTLEEASVCIDQFEFPSIPCEYPVVWVRADEAVRICEAMGKRLCDAHEWEGACEGRLLEPDYDFSIKDVNSSYISSLRKKHNAKVKKTYAYGGDVYKKGICAASSIKNEGCNGGDWNKCGSNTYPEGSFPECKSSLDVYDLHGNAAEHMNLPLKKDEMSSLGSRTYGYTEMKGSWFIFDKYKAHDDYCRWRAPFWHGTKVMDKKSHHNYHLGFRCCSNVVKTNKD